MGKRPRRRTHRRSNSIPPSPATTSSQKDDVNQSNIRMVELGTRRDNPDYYAIQVFNEAFGGGFSSRLFMANIRTIQGPGLLRRRRHRHRFRPSWHTAHRHGHEKPKHGRGHQGPRPADRRPAKQAHHRDEIKRAKDSILNSFIFNFDSPDKVLRERMAYEFYGYPADFLERFQRRRRESYARRRGPRRRKVPAQGSACSTGGGQSG